MHPEPTARTDRESSPADTGEERAVSPVIGVILMVAITVVLAATVGTFFIGFDDRLGSERPPNTVFDTEYGSDGASQELDVDITGGESVARANVQVQVSGASCAGVSIDPNKRYTAGVLGASSTELMAGTTFNVDEQLCAGNPLDISEASVNVVWVAPGGGSSQIMFRWRGPNA